MASQLERELRELVLALALFLAGLGYAVMGLPANVVVGSVIWTIAWLFVSHLFFTSDWTVSCPIDVKIILWGSVTFLVVLALWRPIQTQYAKEHAPPSIPSKPLPEIGKPTPPAVLIRPAGRTYLIFDGVHIPGRVDTKTGQPIGDEVFQIGDKLFFNVYFKTVGPNPVELVKLDYWVYVEPDHSAETQAAVVADFKKRLRREKAYQSEFIKDAATLMPNERRFNSAYASSETKEPKIITQADLDGFQAGTEWPFLLVQITYKDKGKVHHLRTCQLLQPPQILNTWAYCREFTNSD